MYPQNAIEWITKLISFDTTSRNSNLDIVNYIKEYLDRVGVESHILHDATRQKANLFATIPPNSSNAQPVSGGIILSGHLDTVPVDGQKWDTDPFHAVMKEDRIYGRGTCDMKGFVAVCLSLTPVFLAMTRTRPIYYAWTYDEEVGCLGAKELAKWLKEQNIKADGCVVGEPTSNRIVVAHKGIHMFRVHVKGKAAHSSLALTKHGCNAIDYAAKLVVKIREIAEDLCKNAQRDVFFDVPYTTMTTNLIQGGNAGNTIPAECNITYEFRNLPTIPMESLQCKVDSYVRDTLLPMMKKECEAADITIESVGSCHPLNSLPEQNPFLLLMRALCQDNECKKVGYATEGGTYALIDIPVIVCGPGSINIAHQANEYVPLKDIKDIESLIHRLVQKNQSPIANL